MIIIVIDNDDDKMITTRITITKNNRGDKFCAEDVAASQWKYTDGSAWHVDTKLRVALIIIYTLIIIISEDKINSTHLCLFPPGELS